MNIYEIMSIAFYIALMIGIGIYSYIKSNNNSDDFLIGGRKMGAAVTALSAGSADMSGWLLMGLPGAMYLNGISSSWIAIGLVIGCLMNYLLVAPRLRIYTEIAQNSITLPVYFENRFKDKTRILRIVSSILIVLFFTLYTSAGIVSGGKLFESAFGLSYTLGISITTLVVVLYTFLGGFLAVSLTDFIQGSIMVIALIIVPLIVIYRVGGVYESISIINTKGYNYLNLFSGTTIVSIISLLSWGLGYFGQPHILVRFMAIGDYNELYKARNIGVSWMIFTISGALLVGLVGIPFLYKFDPQTMILFDSNKNEAETIFIYFSRNLFPSIITGILLSAILAAVMSTISSQLLVTSSSLTEDLYKAIFSKKNSHKTLVISRIFVLLVAIIALILSIHPKDSILNLVGNAWAGFGASFGPLIILSLFYRHITWQGAITGMIVGGFTVLLWIYLEHPYKDIYEIIPGFIFSFFSILIVSRFTKKYNNSLIEEEFNKMKNKLNNRNKI